jgi:hypothetical protein
MALRSAPAAAAVKFRDRGMEESPQPRMLGAMTVSFVR